MVVASEAEGYGKVAIFVFRKLLYGEILNDRAQVGNILHLVQRPSYLWGLALGVEKVVGTGRLAGRQRKLFC